MEVKSRLMRKYLSAAIILLTVSCDVFEEVGEITFPTTLEETIEVNEPDPSNGKNYTASRVLHLEDNSEIAPYLDKLKEVKIESISYRVTEFTGAPNTIVSGTLGLSPTSATSPSPEWVIELSENLATSSGTGYKLWMTDGAIKDELAALLIEQREVKIHLNTRLSQTPVRFNIDIKVELAVTAQALR
jgi:hypothetical protein